MSNLLNNLERAALEALLAGDHPILATLRQQVSTCRVKSRKFTGCGFFTHLDVGQSSIGPVMNVERLCLDDVGAEIAGLKHGVGFVLFIDHGYLDTLEGFSYDEPWPSSLGSFKLKYMKGEDRDWTALEESLRQRP